MHNAQDCWYQPYHLSMSSQVSSYQWNGLRGLRFNSSYQRKTGHWEGQAYLVALSTLNKVTHRQSRDWLPCLPRTLTITQHWHQYSHMAQLPPEVIRKVFQFVTLQIKEGIDSLASRPDCPYTRAYNPFWRQSWVALLHSCLVSKSWSICALYCLTELVKIETEQGAALSTPLGECFPWLPTPICGHFTDLKSEESMESTLVDGDYSSVCPPEETEGWVVWHWLEVGRSHCSWELGRFVIWLLEAYPSLVYYWLSTCAQD